MGPKTRAVVEYVRAHPGCSPEPGGEDDPGPGQYGTLTAYLTGTRIRFATRDEWLNSVSDKETGVWTHPDHGSVFVAGGPEFGTLAYDRAV